MRDSLRVNEPGKMSYIRPLFVVRTRSCTKCELHILRLLWAPVSRIVCAVIILKVFDRKVGPRIRDRPEGKVPVAFVDSGHVDEAAEMRSSENGLCAPGKSRSFVRDGKSFDLEGFRECFFNYGPAS